MYVSYLFGSRYVFVILLFRTLLMSSFFVRYLLRYLFPPFVTYLFIYRIR